MNSFFTKDNIVASAKRHQHARSRKAKASNWKDLCPLIGKPLHAVPEEDESLYQQTLPTTPSSCTSQPACSASRSTGGRATPDFKPAEKRASRPRPIGLTGVEHISVKGTIDLEYESPRPAPRPPLPSTSPTPSSPRLSSYDSDASASPDSFNLQFSDIGLILDFPQPPSSVSRCRLDPPRSPTPSLVSNCTTSTSGSNSSANASSGIPTTPVTSDDESFPPVRPLAIPNKPIAERHSDSAVSGGDETNDWIDDDSDWYTKQFEDILTLCSPLPASFREPSSADKPAAARPDSIVSVSTSRRSSVCSRVSGPSAQLDPTFPIRRRSAIKLPCRPPPPVPSRRRTRCSYDMPNNATRPTKTALTIAVPTRPRPPPRMSVPADVSELISPDGTGVLAKDDEEYGQEFIFQPETPSVYSQDTASDDGEFYANEMASPLLLNLELPLSLSPMDLQLEIATSLEEVQRRGEYEAEGAIPDTPVGEMYSPLPAQERALRSRWSSSTLSSIAESQQPMSASSRILRFNFAGAVASRRRKKEKGRSTLMSLGGLASPKSVTGRRSMESELRYSMEPRTLARAGSRSSKASDSAESCDSAGSSGLRRKPIPVEMFIRC